MRFVQTIYLFIYLFIYYFHNKDYTSITLYKDVARGPQKTTRLVRGGPLVTIILSNRTITTHKFLAINQRGDSGMILGNKLTEH